MARRFEDKVALVTGAASGIGRSSALAFASEGARVVVSDVDISGGEETVAMIKKAGSTTNIWAKGSLHWNLGIIVYKLPYRRITLLRQRVHSKIAVMF